MNNKFKTIKRLKAVIKMKFSSYQFLLLTCWLAGVRCAVLAKK